MACLVRETLLQVADEHSQSVSGHTGWMPLTVRTEQRCFSKYRLQVLHYVLLG